MGNTITDNIGTLHPRAHDLYRQYPGDVVNARHNIWTVYPPTEYICSPLAEFDTDNGYGAAQIAQDVYISPLGDNSNSGLDPLNPLRNIHHALARLAPITPGTIRNLHLASGTYSYISNAEYFPIPLFSNLRILGASMDSVVVDLPGFLGGFLLEECDSVTIANLTIQHSDAWAMQSNHGWDLDFRSLNLHHNDQGIVSSGDTLITVSNCIFSWNQTESSGGGIFIEHCYGEVINSTFFGNRAGECGGGIACVFSGELWVENCILWGNHAAIISPDIYGTAIPMITVTYTDIEQGWTSIGNISLDPQFVDTSEATPDFRLGHGSPCIDAGNPDPWYNDPNGTRNDMGAYGGPYAQGWMGVVDDRREDIIPSKPEIIALYPNPANPTATLIYQIAQPSWVSIDLYNILGQHITTLRKHPQLPGTHTITIDGSRWSSGTYFCRIASGDFPVTRKFVIIR